MKKFIKTAFAGLLLCLLLLAGSISVHAQIHFDRASVNVLNGSSRKVRISCKGKYSVATTDDSIATVTHSGKVKGKKAGSCEIVVTCGAESARLPVHVLRSLRDGSILFLGHRGYQGKYPENTISSFEGALNYGADGVELDVHITNSKDLLVFHDGSLSRVSGKQGKIRNLTEQTRKKYRVKGGGKSDQIPTLEEALRYLKSRNATVFIHLKNGKKFTGSNADLVARCIRECGMEKQCVVFNSNCDSIWYFTAHHPDIPTGFFYGGSSPSQARGRMRKAASRGASWFFFYSKRPVFFSMIQYAHQCGLRAALYQTRKKSDILQLLDYGADFTIMYRRLI